jgi:transposase-like protein
LYKDTHLNMLTHLSHALGPTFTIEKQKTITIVTNDNATLIKAWLSIFPGIHHLLYCLHFMQNIVDKLRYKLSKRTNEEQCNAIILLINGKYSVQGLLDMINKEIEESLEKTYSSL